LIQVLDIGINNLTSLTASLNGLVTDKVEVVSEPSGLRHDGLLVLPGTGAFGAAMSRLVATGLAQAVVERHRLGQGFTLGVCLGMQLLAESSEESPEVDGLAIVPGGSHLLESCNQSGERVPRVGWEEVRRSRPTDFEDFLTADALDFYFSHSFHLLIREPERYELLISPFGGNDIVVGFRTERLAGCQFHPEKSSKNGLRLLEDFLRWSGEI